jgi:hypothetical protein
MAKTGTTCAYGGYSSSFSAEKNRKNEFAANSCSRIGQWLDVKRCFIKILLERFRSTPRTDNALRTIDRLQVEYRSLLPFALPIGTQLFHGPYEVRELYSSYIWEVRDRLHRDGLSLKRRREKFEHLIVDSGKSALKGRFWSWLDKETKGQLVPCRYVQPKDREEYLARFENGVLVHPSLPSVGGDVEAMFVVDEWGNMYIGIKSEGKSKQDPGFNHASLLCGGNVASAGKITFRSGKPIHMTDHSGHYRCGAKEMEIALRVLQTMGVAIESIEVHAGSGRGKDKQQCPLGGVFTSQSIAAS